SSGNNMEKHLFNLKFAAKDLERNAKKCEKDEKVEKNKLKTAIQKGNMEGAKIHAENSIRQKNQALNYRRMASRIDAVAARVQTAVTTKQVTKSMAGVVKGMEAAMKSMNLEQISQLMDRFEREFENLDVQSQVMEGTMCNTSTLTAPEGEVNMLMQEAADEAGIEIKMQLPDGGKSTVGTATASGEQDELSQRLAALRQN
ncbi:hypothetical protein BOX15_Mlig033068g1, partial [Macrostomum lignano]